MAATSMADEVVSMLVTGSFGTAGTTLFSNHLPATPDVCAVATETFGQGNVGFFGDALGIDQPNLQLRTRGGPSDSESPRTLIERIRQYLTNLGATTVNTVRYMAFIERGTPFILDRDGKDRVVWAMNFTVMKGYSPTS